MPNFSSITLIGHLGRDISIKDVGDKKVASTSLAVTKKRGNEEVTSWFDLSFWGRQAEIAAQYLAKGSAVMIVGEPSIEQYELKKGDRAGQMATKVSVFVKEFTMLGAKKEAEASTTAPSARQSAPTQKIAKQVQAEDDSVPF